MSGGEIEKKFWNSPELVEGLLVFLDPASILELAQAHPLTKGVMQGRFVWSRFIWQNCPHPAAPGLTLSAEEYTELSKQWRAGLEPIIGILQAIGNPQSHLLELLDIICESFPPLDPQPAGKKFGRARRESPVWIFSEREIYNERHVWR